MELVPHFGPLSILAFVFLTIGGLCSLGGYLISISEAFRKGCLTGGAGCLFSWLFLIPFMLVNWGTQSSRAFKLLGVGMLSLVVAGMLMPHPQLVGVFNNLDGMVVVSIGKQRAEIQKGGYLAMEGTAREAVVSDKNGKLIEKVALPPVDCLYNIKGKGNLYVADYSALYGRSTVSLNDIRVKYLQGATKIYQLPASRELLAPDGSLPRQTNSGTVLRVERPSAGFTALENAKDRASRELSSH